MVESEQKLIEEIFNAVDEKGALLTITFNSQCVVLQMYYHGFSRDATIDRKELKTAEEVLFEMIRAVRMLLYAMDKA